MNGMENPSLNFIFDIRADQRKPHVYRDFAKRRLMPLQHAMNDTQNSTTKEYYLSLSDIQRKIDKKLT